MHGTFDSQAHSPIGAPRRRSGPLKTLSPFRYPGGKSWYVPAFREWLSTQDGAGIVVEPFAGGAVVILSALAADPTMRGAMCERDDRVASVWKVALGASDGDFWRLASSILDFTLDRDTATECLSTEPTDLVALAFQTILRNRVNRGGVIARRGGLLRSGERNMGIASRWYPDTLVARLRGVRGLRDRLDFHHGDGFDLIARHANDRSAALFVDPPYTAGGKRAGSRLYTHSELDHGRLFAECAAFAGAVNMTYDDAPEVRELAALHGFELREVAMRNAHHARMSELSIFRPALSGGKAREGSPARAAA